MRPVGGGVDDGGTVVDLGGIDAEGRQRGAGLGGRIERRRAAEIAVRAGGQDLARLAEAGALGQDAVEQGRRDAHDDEAVPLDRLVGAHGDVGPLGHHPSDEAGRPGADRIGREILEEDRVAVGGLQLLDDAREPGALKRRVGDGSGEVVALGGRVDHAAVLIEEDEVGVTGLRDELAGDLLDLGVAASVHRAGGAAVEGDALLDRPGRPERLQDGGVTRLLRIEILDQVGKVRDDLRMGRRSDEVGLHPVCDEFDPVPARRRGELQARAGRVR